MPLFLAFEQRVTSKYMLLYHNILVRCIYNEYITQRAIPYWVNTFSAIGI